MFINLCPICNLKLIQTGQPRLNPIRSEDFNSRGQLDLVDMRHNPCKIGDKTYLWIAHYIDHYSKLNIIWEQQQKTADEVVYGFRRFVLSYFGLPKILQCDNGLEFKNELMRKLVLEWDGKKFLSLSLSLSLIKYYFLICEFIFLKGECKIIHGRPRHPQSQGLVEQSNGTLERMLAAFMAQENRTDWVNLLTKIQYNMNTQQHSGYY